MTKSVRRRSCLRRSAAFRTALAAAKTALPPLHPGRRPSVATEPKDDTNPAPRLPSDILLAMLNDEPPRAPTPSPPRPRSLLTEELQRMSIDAPERATAPSPPPVTRCVIDDAVPWP